MRIYTIRYVNYEGNEMQKFFSSKVEACKEITRIKKIEKKNSEKEDGGTPEIQLYTNAPEPLEIVPTKKGILEFLNRYCDKS